METGYSEREIASELDEIFADESRLKDLYKEKIINYRGQVTGDKNHTPSYTEIIADYICEHFHEFMGSIKTITREKSYHTKSHNIDVLKIANTNRKEEIFAKELFQLYHDKCNDEIGKIIDFQTPLKNKQEDGAGKIDLISYNSQKNELYLIELKKADSSETLLRCLLEIITYYKTVNRDKLLKDFSDGNPGIKTATILCAPMVFVGGKQEEEYKHRKEHTSMMCLINKLQMVCPIKILTVDESHHIQMAK